MKTGIDGNNHRGIARRSKSLTAITAIVFALAAAPAQSEIERASIYTVAASDETRTEPINRTTLAPERSGEQIVRTICFKCHQEGVGGAPRIGDRAAWIPRAKNGFDVLIRSAINGHGNMPARGGVANLTDGEIRAAISYMLNPVPVVAKTPVSAAVKPDPHHQIIDGTEIFLGVVSAESIRKQHPGSDPESAMHKGIPRGSGYYHLNISLYDAETRSVIKDAQVEVRIADPIRGEQAKVLEPMVFNNTVSYGNYFRLSGKDPYTIAVLIRKSGDSKAIQTKFEFRQ